MQHGGHTGNDIMATSMRPETPEQTDQIAISETSRGLSLMIGSVPWPCLAIRNYGSRYQQRSRMSWENTPEFLATGEELEQLSMKSKDDPMARDRRKGLFAQRRKLVSEELR